MYRHSRDASIPFHSNGLHSALDSLEHQTAIKIVLIFRLSRSSDKCIDVNRDSEGNGVASKLVEYQSNYRVANSTHELVDHPVIGNEEERDREQIEIIEIALRLYSLSVSSRYQQIRGINTISKMGLYLSLTSVVFFRRGSRWD